MALNKIINDFVESADYDFSQDGFIELENGLIIQWGLGIGGGGASSGVVNFPTPFKSQILNIQATDSTQGFGNLPFSVYANQGLTGFSWYCENDPGGFYWFAIGV